jgi:DNA-binding MarR family transcriptional regulator
VCDGAAGSWEVPTVFTVYDGGVGVDDGSRLVGNLSRLTVLMRRSIAARMAHETWAIDAGFRPGCIGVMLMIDRYQPVSQQRISAETGLDPSDVVGMVDILEGAALVERHRDPRDRRRYSLELTPDGKGRADRLRQLLSDVIDEITAPLPREDRDRLAALVNVVIQHHFGGDSDDRPAEIVTPLVQPPSPEKARGRRSPPQ